MTRPPGARQGPFSLGLALGDLAAYLLATVLGFARHAELGSQAAPRMLATAMPFFAAWLAVAPWLGAYDRGLALEARRLWRPPLAAVYAAPIGGILRGAWLSSPVQPTFILVMAGVTAGLILVWRVIFLIVATRRG